MNSKKPNQTREKSRINLCGIVIIAKAEHKSFRLIEATKLIQFCSPNLKHPQNYS